MKRPRLPNCLAQCMRRGDASQGRANAPNRVTSSLGHSPGGGSDGISTSNISSGMTNDSATLVPVPPN